MFNALCLIFSIFCTPDNHHYQAKLDLSHPAIEHKLTAPRVKPDLIPPVYWDGNCKVSPINEYKKLYNKAAQKYPSLFTACILATQGQAESGFDPNAVSPVGAMGIAQFMPGTAKQYGIDPFNPEEAIPAQANYMKWCQNFWTPGLGGRTQFDMKALALVCYNFGPGASLKNQEKHGWILYAEAKPNLPEETQNYIRKILK